MSGHTRGSWLAHPHELHAPLWYVLDGDKEMVTAQRGTKDAHLIAAAPDLLLAAKRIVTEFAGEEPDTGQYAIRRLEAAIAKAEGEE